MILPDLLITNLDLVFCGTAVGNKSAKRKAYYAGPGNLFYPILASCGFTPRILMPEEYPELLNFRIGLTDLAKDHFGVDKYMKFENYNVQNFIKKIKSFNPRMICFNGKESARIYFNLKHTKQVHYGLQHQTIGNTKIYVATSTSSQARRYWDEKTWLGIKKEIFY